jgi:NCS1 family nucleobase:cation symporter-1
MSISNQTTLNPILKEEDRILGPKAYIAMWWGDAIYVGAFMIGSSLVPPFGQLNMYQAFTSLFLANLIVALVLAFNGLAGWKHGIPMVVQLRSSFGPIGAKVPSLMRGVPALFWYGIQTWLGAMAINEATTKLFGFDQVWVWFIAFQALQIYLSARGMKTIKWFEVTGSVFIMLGLVYLVFLFLSTFGVQIQKTTNIDGTWGFPFWIGLTAMFGSFAALFINVSDYTRYFPRASSTSSYIGSHIAGLLPPSLIMPFIGILGAAAVGLWNPVDVISKHIPSPFITIFMLIFIAIAQITTNLVANILPPALVSMEIFKLSWAKSCILVGVLAIFTFPWWIMQAAYFFKFITVVSAFLGPIFAVMAIDFYVIHKRNYNVARLYDMKDLFKKFKGWNPAAVISIIFGMAFSFIKLEISWFLGIIPTALIYYVLMKYWIVKHEPYVYEGMTQDMTKMHEGMNPNTKEVPKGVSI